MKAPSTVWWAGMVECRICSHRHAQVMEIPAGSDDPEDTECPHCGNMTCDPVDEEEGGNP